MYRPSQRPSFRLRMFPSPFARLFGMVSAPFATNNTVTKRAKLSENRTVIRKLSFALRPRCPIFDYCGAIFALPGAFSLVTAVRFSNCQEALSLTTAAQNIPVFLRKSPLCRSHFFEWLKAANFSTACGTSTLKNPPSRGSDASHVHQRLRKRLARCTLDCGFKTPESPALRGFVAERGPITGTSLYLVLKSNGPHRSKNPPVKFGFSSKSVPANIAKKLLPQRCSKPLFIPIFNFSHKRPTFAFTSESGYTLGFRRKIAHKGTHGETGVFRMGALSLPSDRFARFGNPAWPGLKTAYFAALGSWPGGALEERRKPAGQRCAYARRCSEASRPRWAA